MSQTDVMPGCEPFTHEGSSTAGVLVIHGFTGNPSSMTYQAQAFADAGYHVEQPRLPGHGTTLEDMMTTDWTDWSGEAAAAYDRLAERAEQVVVIGLSMGGTLTLWTGLERQADPKLKGLICVNAATAPQGEDVIAMIQEMMDEGNDVMPGIGSDIADPDVTEIAYEGTPLKQLMSLSNDGLAPITGRYGELKVPVLILSSTDDHVVPPENSAHLRDTAGGEVEFVTLERSYHVATQDYDRDLINQRSLAFIERVTS
ncbi:MAG: alpha/beta fold hydrolase [Ilumatobacter sp.]|uniref:alpha/beta hydrolase n=1 Tax=Ilumatobacter sp. TaxID=1967498 RepID=UPI00329A5E7F